VEALVTYELADGVATIAMDDGKVNVMSLAMQDELNAALDRAADDGAVVVIEGREGVFSAGFDLPTLRGGGDDGWRMVRGGFELAHRVLGFPLPVVMACTGHAIAMGTFLLVSGDYRIGAQGAYKFQANEVAIGLTFPRVGIEILRQRLTPAAFNRAALLAEPFSPDDAVAAGFVDRVVAATEVKAAARHAALQFAALDLGAHARTKAVARRATLDAMRESIDTEYAGPWTRS
jgi:enoyl-CoA hydratase/carnithine racemase